MKTILITGINGFLGSHLAKALQKHYNIIGLEYSLENLFRIKDHDFKVYSSKKEYEAIFQENKIFAIIHTATIYLRQQISVESLINTNILLPVKLLELGNKYNCEIFLNTDSFFNNNNNFNYSYLSEYTLSKKQVLEWLKVVENECKLINMKVFHMYGPNDSKNKFVPTMIEKLRQNENYINITEGEQTRDFIYIDDVVNAFKCILDNAKLGALPYKEYEVGTGESTSIKSFLIKAKKILGSKTELRFGALPYRENEIMSSVANNSSLLSLGWKPEYSIDKGLDIIGSILI